MKCIIGKKLGMTHIFDEAGKVVPVTAVEGGACVIMQVKNKEKDGYQAIKLGYGSSKKLKKPIAGINKKVNTEKLPYFHEFVVPDVTPYKPGEKISVTTFSVGDNIKVSGFSKGKGFQGVVKRHGFAGSPATHGHKDQLRMPGSSGSGYPQRVFKGKRMGGRMGNDSVTVRNLSIAKVDEKTNQLFIKGAIPGARNGWIFIESL